jgi:hypothetical protein
VIGGDRIPSNEAYFCIVVTIYLCYYLRVNRKESSANALRIRAKNMLRTFWERFWIRVDKSGGPKACWFWKGSITGSGYGEVWRGNKAHLCHRVVWERTHEAIPKGYFVCHHCDVRDCVNPDHLFCGTAKDNVRDCYNKGRHPKNGYRSRLTDEQVVEIKRLRAKGVLQSSLATRFNVDQSHISRIVNGKACCV